jgi:hypothetical protein
MQHLGWSLGQDHAARWRALFAALRTEISDATHATNYVFVFERLLQLVRKEGSTIPLVLFSLADAVLSWLSMCAFHWQCVAKSSRRRLLSTYVFYRT